MPNLEIGAITEGKIVNIKPFGAIISLGDNKQGLVHISQVSHEFVKDITTHLTEGDMVKVKIISIDEQTGRIALSMKDAMPPKVEEPKVVQSSFEDKMKEWLKASNELQTTLNKRKNKR